MNKMAEKISAVMSDEELQQLIADHYRGEAQLLTGGTEANLLKLAELQGSLTLEQQQRWQAIKAEFQRQQSLGGEGEVGDKIVAQLYDLVEQVKQLREPLNHTVAPPLELPPRTTP